MRRFLPLLSLLAAGCIASHGPGRTLTLADFTDAGGKAPSGGWSTDADGTIHLKGRGGNLMTREEFRDFTLDWDWKVAPGGNNGVKYFVTEARTKSPGHEYQMLDDNGHPDGKIGPHRRTGAFYDVLPPAADKPSRAPGEWNSSRLVVQGNRVEHWLNGKNVLTYELGSDAVKAGLAKSKFAKEAGFGDKITGHIMLTYHQDNCWYRNIKIRELK
jgi:hypothetical protein